jgi:hypothetical protein
MVAREAPTTAGGLMPTAASRPRLTNLYLRLADDPSLLERFERDPRRALADAGFATVEIDALLESPERARAALDAELSSDADLLRLVTTPRMSTQGDDDDDDNGDEDEDD